MKLRNRAIAFVLCLLFGVLLLWVNQDKIELPPVFIYWVQVFSGNWSPDFAQKPDYQNHRFSFLAGSVIAVILNLITIVSIVAAAVGIFIIKGQKMKYRTLLDLKDDITLRKMLELFPQDQRKEMMALVEQKIREANTEWEHETVGVVVSPEAKTAFFHAIDRNFDMK